MITTLVLAAIFLAPFPQKPQASAPSDPKAVETGVIAGTVVGGVQGEGSGPVQVILLSSEYTNLWNGDVQRRLDVYWERYKPAFAVQKEFFFEVSRMAHREATEYVLGRLRRDTAASEYLKQATPEGRFEFKNIPFGEYKILALGKVGDRETIWQQSIDVRSPVPQFLELKNRLP